MPLGNPSQQAQVFGRRLDPWTNRALDLLERVKLPCQFVDLDPPENEKLVAQLIAETKCYQTPYVYVRGAFVGGFAELDERERLGQLIAEPPRRGRAEVVIVGRDSEFVAPALSGRKPPKLVDDDDPDLD